MRVNNRITGMNSVISMPFRERSERVVKEYVGVRS